MKQQNNSGPLPWLLLAVPVLWAGAALASGYRESMTVFDLMGRFSIILERPFDIRWTPYTLKFMLVGLVLYAFAVTLYFSSRQNKRPGEEHGSAHWGNVHTLNLKYRDKDPHNNVILTQNLRMSLNGRKHLRNLLQIVVGGSGSGKTRYVVKPNLYEANASYIATDPKGGATRS
ncbi:type IV secretory system conjugative DNA transfer family protein [Oscillospiraceae bacterium 44-5]